MTYMHMCMHMCMCMCMCFHMCACHVCIRHVMYVFADFTLYFVGSFDFTRLNEGRRNEWNDGRYDL